MAKRVPKNQKRHGNLSPKASQVYEDLRDEHPGYSKKKAAKIANAVANHTVNRKGRKKKKKG
jgi:hypothetical protein